MIRRIKSGRVIEESMFRVAAQVRPRKPRQKGASTVRKQDANDKDALRRLARVINCNFRAGDLLLGPDWSEEALARLSAGLSGDALEELRSRAEHELELFLRRLGREMKKQGLPLQAVYLTSDLDGDTGELVRVHHHVVVSGKGLRMEDGQLWIGDRAVDEIWGRGHVDWQPLKHQDDYTPLAAYLLRQVRKQADRKKWRSTRNLKKPVLISERIVYSSKKLRAPKGAKILQDGNYEPGMPHYIRYVRPTRTKRKDDAHDLSVP
jgi:hypothetical protein